MQLEGINNEKEIKENCELYLKENKIDFCYKYIFPKEGKYNIKVKFDKPLKNINYIFRDCDKLLSIDLFNFNTNNVTDMRYIFIKNSNEKINNKYELHVLSMFFFNFFRFI